MIKIENIKDINLEKLDEEIQNQLKERDSNNDVISLCNKMMLVQPPVFIVWLLAHYFIDISNYEDFLTYMFYSGGLNLIYTTFIVGVESAFFGITKKKFKNKNKILIKELNNNLSIQKQLEFNKSKSLEITDVEIKENLNTIKEIELPQISIGENNKNKPKTRTLKKDSFISNK